MPERSPAAQAPDRGTTAPQASIVVVTHNSAEPLATMLPPLIESGAEVIVVDNASRDDSVRVARAAGARVVAVPNNAGYAVACNRGISAAGPNAEWIGFVNPDVRIDPAQLTQLLSDVPADIWALSPLTLTAAGSPQPDVARPAPTAAFVAAMFLGLKRSQPPPPHLLDPRAGRHLLVDVLSGGALFVRRKAFEAAGQWDEAYFFNGEDIDLSVRIGRAGGRLAVDRTVRVAHDKQHSSASVDGEGRRLENARGYVTYFQIHGSPAQTALVAACAFTGCAIRRVLLSFRPPDPNPMRGFRSYRRLLALMWTGALGSYRHEEPVRPAQAEFLDA